MANPNEHCKSFAIMVMRRTGLTSKHIGVTEHYEGSYFVETPKQKRECSAHCKWCAIAETILNL
jgi:hypothetical protein